MDINSVTFAILVAFAIMLIYVIGKLITAWYRKSRDEFGDDYWQDIQDQVNNNKKRLDYIETNYLESGSENTDELAERTKSQN